MTFRNSGVILLNADYSFLNIVDWKKAMTLLAKGKVAVHKYSNKVIKTAAGKIVKIPYILRLIKFIRTLYKSRVPFSKKNVLVRDGFACAYCGDKSKRLTIDHIVPKAKGGKSTFENCVAACRNCNNRKGSKTCREAHMFPRVKAYQPTISEFLRMKMEKLGILEIIKESFE